MPTTQYTMNFDVTNGTSNIMNILAPHQQQALRLIAPRDVEKVFGPGIDVDIPSKGYTDPEWYWVSSKQQVWGIGWRYGQARLRGRGMPNHDTELSSDDASEFVNFLMLELDI